MFRKRVTKQKGKEKIGRNVIGIKIPDSNEIGIKFLEKVIPTLPKMKLLGTKGKIESYPDSEEKTILLEIVKKEFEKRGIEYLDLSKNN